MYYPIRVAYVGPNRADRDRNARGNRDYYVIRSQPGCTNMSHQPLTEGWLGQTGDWSECALGECETIEQARQAIRDDVKGQISEWWDDCGVDYDEHDPDLVEAWIPRNIHEGDLITVDWDAEDLGITTADGIVWLASVDDAGDEYDLAWEMAAEALGLGQEDHGNRDPIIAHLREHGWQIEVVSDAGWDAWYCVGKRPE